VKALKCQEIFKGIFIREAGNIIKINEMFLSRVLMKILQVKVP